jgi:hypothetical protein
MGFRLNEMKMIFHYKNFAKLTDYEVDAYYQSIFLKKYEELDHEIKTLVEARDRLKQKIDQLPTSSQEPSCLLGVDLAVLGMLRCMKCAGHLMHTVDMVVDHTGTSNYSFEHEAFLLDEVDSLVKPDGYLVGSYLVFKNFSPKSKIEARYRKNFTIKTIKENIGHLKYKALDERISEPIDKGGRFEDFFVPGEEIYSYLLFGKR